MPFSDSHINEVLTKGFCILHSLFKGAYVDRLREILDLAVVSHNELNTSLADVNMVHNCHEVNIEFLKCLEHSLIDSILSSILQQSYIIYAFQSSSLPPFGTNNARRIHCDTPRTIPSYITNIGVIITLDEYTDQTGAIEFMPYSRELLDIPSQPTFESSATPVHCPKGSVIIFDARTYHREGINKTSSYRHSLTCNFCRCYMRQRFDYVRMAQSSGLILRLTSNQRKLLGYNVRVPVSMEEYFYPSDRRLYLPGQES